MSARDQAEAQLRVLAIGLYGAEGAARLLERVAARDRQQAELLRAALVELGAEALLRGVAAVRS